MSFDVQYKRFVRVFTGFSDAPVLNNRLCNWAMGLCGEAGEVSEHVKKLVFHRKPLDRIALVLELGDVEFYLEALRDDLGITREEVIANNMAKLCARRPSQAKQWQDAEDALHRMLPDYPVEGDS